MNPRNLLVTALLILSSGPLMAQSNDAIEGKWQDTAHPEKKVAVYAEHGQYVGKDPDDPSRLIFKDLRWSAKSKTYRGLVINPDNGNTYDIEIEMTDQDNFRFSVGPFIFKKTFRFERI